jgi:hypothetical protein
MTDSVSNASVALSLIVEALSLLDSPEHGKAAAFLQNAIDELSSSNERDVGSNDEGSK